MITCSPNSDLAAGRGRMKYSVSLIASIGLGNPTAYTCFAGASLQNAFSYARMIAICTVFQGICHLNLDLNWCAITYFGLLVTHDMCPSQE